MIGLPPCLSSGHCKALVPEASASATMALSRGLTTLSWTLQDAVDRFVANPYLLTVPKAHRLNWSHEG